MKPNTGEAAASAEGVGSKERIFHAAMSVALRKGFGNVTLSLVAREARLSKGGLLHHFATKSELIRAMLEFYADPASPHALSLHLGEANSSISDFDPFAVAVLIAAAENPALLIPFSKIFGIGNDRSPVSGSLPLLGSLANRLAFGAAAAQGLPTSRGGRPAA